MKNLGNPRRVLTLLLFILTFDSPSTLSQTVWFKYSGNPVLDVGSTGTWDERFVHISRVIHEDSLYKMWYSGGWTLTRTGYATSRDGISWKKYFRNPVLDVSPGAWDSKAAHRGYIIRSGSVYEMWYNGDSLGTFHIGYAISTDGIHWKKLFQPVLNPGPPGSWDREHVGWATVLGPDSSGGFKMWYGGQPEWKIGFASATNETSWTKMPDPVFSSDRIVYQARVLQAGSHFQMWYTEGVQPAPLSYATSPDGIQWTRSDENPVLQLGPSGSWDDAGLTTGDVLLEGTVFHMWYNASDGSGWRGGYAISPRGTTLDISPSYDYIAPKKGKFRVRLRVDDPSGLSFTASIKTPGPYTGNPTSETGLLALREVARLTLMDDGTHDDSLAHDGIYGDDWIPLDEELHFVDLDLHVNEHTENTFQHEHAAVFTSIGPITIDSVEFLSDVVAHPGDTVIVRLSLRNRGGSASARSVRAHLTSDDPSITQILEFSPTYGEIRPGERGSTAGYYKILVNPFSPNQTVAAVRVSITSWGISLWKDQFSLRITPPWWKTSSALFLYAGIVFGTILMTVRYVEVRRSRRRIASLKREQETERERVRISQDMHDEIGSALSEIALLTELARRNPAHTDQYLREISARAAEVIAGIGEIVWAINPKADTIDNLIAYLRRHTVKYLDAAGISCTFDVPEDIPSDKISGESRRNIFLVLKESLHNIVKHSGANSVSVSVMISGRSLSIRISDNGRGLGTDVDQHRGNGMDNMKKRMKAIGGTCTIETMSGSGVSVSLRVPLPAD